MTECLTSNHGNNVVCTTSEFFAFCLILRIRWWIRYSHNATIIARRSPPTSIWNIPDTLLRVKALVVASWKNSNHSRLYVHFLSWCRLSDIIDLWIQERNGWRYEAIMKCQCWIWNHSISPSFMIILIWSVVESQTHKSVNQCFKDLNVFMIWFCNLRDSVPSRI